MDSPLLNSWLRLTGADKPVRKSPIPTYAQLIDSCHRIMRRMEEAMHESFNTATWNASLARHGRARGVLYRLMARVDMPGLDSTPGTDSVPS